MSRYVLRSLKSVIRNPPLAAFPMLLIFAIFVAAVHCRILTFGLPQPDAEALDTLDRVLRGEIPVEDRDLPEIVLGADELPELRRALSNSNADTGFVPRSMYSTRPYKVEGKLYFQTEPGSFMWGTCTATIVAKNKLLTAGHCVMKGDGSPAYDRIFFVPQYREGTYPEGEYHALNVSVFDEWMMSGYHPRDVAAIRVGDNDRGSGSVADNVGAQAYTHGCVMGVGSSVTAVGYPGEPYPYEGEKMVRSKTSISGAVDDWGKPAMWSYDSNMGQGASGGGVFEDDYTVCSVNSAKVRYQGESDYFLIGPKMDSQALALIDSV